MEQLTKNQAVATSQEAVQNQNEPQLRDENAHNDKSVHGVLNPTYQAGLRRDAVQPDIEAERKREMRLRLGKVTVADVLAAQPVTTNLLKFMPASIKMIGVSNLQSFIASMTQKLTLSDISDESKNYLDRSEERFSRNAETDLVCRLLLEKKKTAVVSGLLRISQQPFERRQQRP